jgi:hypothetical protein
MGWRIDGNRSQLLALPGAKPHPLHWRLIGKMGGAVDVILAWGRLWYTNLGAAETVAPPDQLPIDVLVRGISVGYNGGGVGLPLGVFETVSIPFSGLIRKWYVNGDPAGSLALDIWRRSENLPGLPQASDSICNGNYIVLNDQDYNSSTDLTGWDTTLVRGDRLSFVIVSQAVSGRINTTLELAVT